MEKKSISKVSKDLVDLNTELHDKNIGLHNKNVDLLSAMNNSTKKFNKLINKNKGNMVKKEKKVRTSKVPKELIDLNFELQNKNIDLLSAMNNLTKRVDKLVGIFEEAAKNVTMVEEDPRMKELTDKLGSLIEQNKTLANGMLLLEKYVRTKTLENPFKKI